MQNMLSAGSDGSAGYTQMLQGRQPLPRLNPREIAILTLPGQSVNVMDATDAQFQAFVTAQQLNIADDESEAWSFDDRCRLINHGRKYGIDLFAANRNNLAAQLFSSPETAANAGSGDIEEIKVEEATY